MIGLFVLFVISINLLTSDRVRGRRSTIMRRALLSGAPVVVTIFSFWLQKLYSLESVTLNAGDKTVQSVADRVVILFNNFREERSRIRRRNLQLSIAGFMIIVLANCCFDKLVANELKHFVSSFEESCVLLRVQ